MQELFETAENPAGLVGTAESERVLRGARNQAVRNG